MASHPQKKRPRKQHLNQPKVADSVDANETASRYADMFTAYQNELDTKHDKYERLVKLSRDCTIHSKRTIFLLHRIGSKTDKTKVLSEANGKICEILKILQAIASELVGEDPDKFHRAFSPGVQEFIEALSYFIFLKTGMLISLEMTQEYLTFHTKVEKGIDEEKSDPSKEMLEEVSKHEILTVPLDPIDFVLGVADLTGELMRMTINAVGSGDHDLPFDLLRFVRAVYCGFSSLRPVSRDIPQKLNVLRSSLAKIERVCYTLKIRGSEIPQNMLVDAFTRGSDIIGTGGGTGEAYDSD